MIQACNKGGRGNKATIDLQHEVGKSCQTKMCSFKKKKKVCLSQLTILESNNIDNVNGEYIGV